MIQSLKSALSDSVIVFPLPVFVAWVVLFLVSPTGILVIINDLKGRGKTLLSNETLQKIIEKLGNKIRDKKIQRGLKIKAKEKET